MLSFADGALLPDPDGTIAAEDRAHLLWLYGGIPLAAAAVVTGIVPITLRKRSIAMTLEPRSITMTLRERSITLTLPKKR
jgi:hypothetical protein